MLDLVQVLRGVVSEIIRVHLDRKLGNGHIERLPERSQQEEPELNIDR